MTAAHTFSVRRLLGALLATALAAVLVAPAGAATASTDATGTWILQVRGAAVADVADDLRRQGVDVVRELRGIGMLVIDAPAPLAGMLDRDPRVSAVTADGGVQVLSTYDPRDDANSMFNVSRVVGARSLWTTTNDRLQWTGRGVDVALLDTGVTPVAGLAGSGKIVNGPDLSFDSQRAETRYLDGFGHGTHMAGIIGGRAANADPSKPGDSGPFMGIAPDARIVNVKVADAWGNADVSQIIAGIDWVVQNRKSNGLNIRVLNLSLGTPSQQGYLADPLSYAAEQAWHKGIVVVVAAGNDGTGTGQLLNPARNPYVIAVGANDSRSTITTDDDVIPAFSTRGDGVRNPDLVAHGASIQSLRVPGSYVDEQHGATAAIGEGFFRGSGTSQAAAVVSGGVALLLQQRPELTPEDVKHLLVSTARPLPAADVQAQGAGMLDLRKASGTTNLKYKKQGFDKSKGDGSLDAARGDYRVEDQDGVLLDGERDIFAKQFESTKHAMKSLQDSAWSGGNWNTSDWVGASWATQGWESVAWTGTDWAGRSWAGRSWAGGTWNGRSWADGYWSGRAWAGRSWAGRSWATGGWR